MFNSFGTRIFVLLGMYLCISFLAASCSDPQEAGHRGEFEQPCYANGACNEGLTCGSDGVCEDCQPGLEGCGCDQFWQCGDGLVCQKDICVLFDCTTPGELGCACDEGQACNDGLTCTPNRQCLECTSDLAGCPCDDNTCGDGLVCNRHQMCERDPALGTRLVDTCFTPCRNDLIDSNGVRRHCSSQGLMRGCIGDMVCEQGSCVPEDHGPRACQSEVDCPDFQTCEFGQCYSTCQNNNDCGGGAQCHRHVCRMPCSGSDSSCEAGTYCDLVDGISGYCLPLGDQNPADEYDDTLAEYADIFLEGTHFGFSTALPQHVSQVTNMGDFTQKFVVRKTRHVENPDEATNTGLSNAEVVTPENGDVLPWLKIAVGGGSLSDEAQLEFTLDPGESTEIITRAEIAQGPERWEGELSILPADPEIRLSSSKIFLNYRGSQAGKWSGNAYYFASFGTNGLKEWVDNKSERSAETVGNAFIRQWRRFVESQTSSQPAPYARLQEVLVATVTESWNTQSVKSICPPGDLGDDAICYLSGVSQGFQFYSQSPSTNPVPSGVTELPVGLNLRPSTDSDSQTMIGRIDSRDSLHYPGNPQITLEFEDDPGSCPNQQSGRDNTCVVPLKNLRSTVIVSGRYQPNDLQEDCQDAEHGREFERTSYPWLVPGFLEGTDFNPDQQSHFKYECRGNKYPWGPGEHCTANSCAPINGSGASAEERELNRLLAQANPVPDGLQRVRRIDLVDGALIDGNILLIIFKETLESFMGEEGRAALDFEGYGYMLLTRQPDDLSGEEYLGVDLEEAAPVDMAEAHLSYQCSDDFVQLINEQKSFDELDELEVRSLAQIMLDGRAQTVDAEDLRLDENWGDRHYRQPGEERVHYLCKFQEVDPGAAASSAGQLKTYSVFNNGPPSLSGTDPDDEQDLGVYCPEEAEVTFFTLVGISDHQLSKLSCNENQNCHVLFNQWTTGVRESQKFGSTEVQIEDTLRTGVFWECKNGSTDMNECSESRNDLRKGKYFYEFAPEHLYMMPIEQDTAQAFRFRTQFLSRDNTAVGFAPDICAPNPNTTPFCYDPEKIEEIRARTDCLLSIYNRRRDDLGPLTTNSLTERVRDHLTRSFSSKTDFHYNGDPKAQTCNPAGEPSCQPVEKVGFERLYAELLIMLGDEAYTRAFASRFDLADSASGNFDGQKFEGQNLGINLSGGVGLEMHTLYQAVQYHQMLLDRFYKLSKGVQHSLDDRASSNQSLREESFISQKIVTIYFDRLIKSSTQKARAWSEVSKRYVQLNRPQLARRVIERAYVSTYLESIIFSRLMDSFGDVAAREDRPQIQQVIEHAQTSYKVALLDMRSAYKEISDDRTLFGFEPDYIPFPVLAKTDANAFERAMSIAESRAATAADKEERALNSDRSKRVDMAEFQTELNTIASNFESELANLCGTVEGTDGTLYPAIPKYIEFFQNAGVLGALDQDEDLRYLRQLLYQDPCGRFGTGELFQAELASSEAVLDYQSERQKWENILSRIDNAETRVKEFCEVDFDITNDPAWNEVSDEIGSLEDNIQWAQDSINTADRALSAALDVASGAVGCGNALATAANADNPMSINTANVAAGTACTAAAGIGIAHGINIGVVEKLKKDIRDDQKKLRNAETKMESVTRQWEHSKNCEVAEIDLNETVANLLLDTLVQKIEIQKAILRMHAADSTVEATRARIHRLQAEYKEAENMSINLAAAQNDPNVRIYKNDSIITADRTFNSAIEATYKATRVFEYYTGQSYANLDKLFLIRTIGFGDYHLEGYLADLADAYIQFQETYGVPDMRVMILSARDDIFQTLLYGPDGMASSQQVRDEDFRSFFTNPTRLNSRGYITIPFSTALTQTSPLTHNHKIVKMQAELVYAGQTDAVARIYVRQKGTGLVRTANSEQNLYRFPERTAVINPFFNGRVRTMGDMDIRSEELDSDIYNTLRFRDLPLVNTAWELVLNLRDEQVNRDIDPDKIKDIRLYVYYTDFTNLK